MNDGLSCEGRASVVGSPSTNAGPSYVGMKKRYQGSFPFKKGGGRGAA